VVRVTIRFTKEVVMKREFFFTSLLLLLLFTPLTGQAQDKTVPQRPAASDYLIGPGDVLFISVWKDEALTQSVPVRPDGKISFPLIGEILAGGKTITELQKEIEQKIARYIPEPNLTIGIQAINSLLVYVIGRVNSPGRFVLNTNINVLQALAMAGGCNSFASRNDIKIFRESQGRTQILEFRYDDVTGGRRLEENVTLRRGDVIVVP
jgi:polysaccharide export outer membrane protein